MPNFGEFAFGTKGKVKKAGLQTQEQQTIMKLISDALTSGTGPLAELFGDFNQQNFEKGVTQPALKNFQENILPQLQEKFIAGNQVGGSGMRRAQFKAGTDLQSQLAQLMYQAQQGQSQNKIAGLQQLLSAKPFENIYKPGTEGAVQGAVKGFAQGAGQAVGAKIAG